MGHRDNARLRMVQFHQAYAYEDFVQGYRPVDGGGFQRQDGQFYDFCKLAEADAERDYVFIVDEINRGNLAKIMGELMMLIEGDKRGVEYALRLSYGRPDERTGDWSSRDSGPAWHGPLRAERADRLFAGEPAAAARKMLGGGAYS
jgi:5-methylcytosine-specific restriction endonuclease McrBC GTP-binding regulatory subunit McrB